ncbi:DUF1828 domain-containing protein [Acinetobacter sp. ANC 4648]|uniref:DUF1828 domain-containing protein n=1 Tax=Acinetobacter sp. ANC 4648 TaxID=1977875 RepID=UPI001D179D4D|nr:DUF1828 domain-containing protein [Acinetobacter sp. ANC 4648]
MMNYSTVKQLLCNSFCRDIGFKELKNGGAIISLPNYDRDGDAYSIYIKGSNAGWLLSDGASTVMRLSYEHDIDDLLKGSRLDLFNSHVADAGAEYDDGELFIEVPADQLLGGLFTLTNLMSRVSDLSLLKQYRIASNFRDELRDVLYSILPKDKVHENYIVPNLPNAEDYTIDYKIDADTPLFLFAANNKDAVRLSVITLQHLEKHNIDFNSIVVLDDSNKVPKQDMNRLMGVANDFVPDLTQVDIIQKKISHRLAS